MPPLVGCPVGAAVGFEVGAAVGALVGAPVGALVGAPVGAAVGTFVVPLTGLAVGSDVTGADVGATNVGELVGAVVGSPVFMQQSGTVQCPFVKSRHDSPAFVGLSTSPFTVHWFHPPQFCAPIDGSGEGVML